MPAATRLEPLMDAFRLRLARSPVPSWLSAAGQALLSLLPRRWRELLGGPRQGLGLRLDGGELQLVGLGDADGQALGRLPLGDDRLLDGLRERVQAAALPAWLLLPPGAVLSRMLSLPAAAEARLREVLAFELDRQTPFPAEQVVFEGRVLSRPPATPTLQVELLVLPRARLEADLRALGPLAGALAGVDVLDAAGHRRGLDLLPATGRAGRAPQRRLEGMLAAFAALALLVAMVWILDNRRDSLEGFRQQVEDATAEARQARALRNQLLASASAANFLATTRAARPTMLELLDDLTRRIPDDTALDKLAVNEGRLVLVGQSRGAPALVGLLQASPLLEEPALSGAVQADPRTGRDRFTLVAQVRGQAPREDGDGRAP